jgi:hypothetical protein
MRTSYVYAVALNSVGQTEQGLGAEAQEHNPVNQNSLLALANLNRAPETRRGGHVRQGLNGARANGRHTKTAY